MKSFLLLLLLCSLFATPVLAQLGMGGTPHPSAALDVQSTNKAFYPPRLTTAQRKAIVNPQAGAFVFDTDKGTFFLCDGQNWLPMAFTTTNNLAPIDRTANDGGQGDVFGITVSISGDYALVSAPIDEGSQGSAYVFFRSANAWTQQAKLTASDRSIGDSFGAGVSISGDYVLVGSPYDDVGANNSQGSAYVFVRNGTTWTQQAKLIASDGAVGDSFGTSVSISGDYAIVGAVQDDGSRGSAYVFIRNGTTWTQQAKLTANDGAAGDYFGYSVSLSGNYALVGAAVDNGSLGSAYVFIRNGITWTQQAKLTASDGGGGDNFGYSVSISGDYALVGAAYDDIGANANQGSAYVFVRSGGTWTQQAKLIASDGAVDDVFGGSVSISGDYALVGAYNNDVGLNANQGSAYVYKRTGTSWSLVRQVVDNAPADTRNGQSVGISNGSFIIGGPGFDTSKGKVAFGTVEN